MPTRTMQRGLLLAIAAAVAAPLVLSSPARAELVELAPNGAPGRLVLSTSHLEEDEHLLSPGRPSHWQISATVEDAARATLALELRKSGELVEHPRGLVKRIDSCERPWTDLDTAPVCSADQRHIVETTPADDHRTSSPTFELDPVTPGAPEYLLVTLSVEDSPAAAADPSLMGLRGDVAFGLIAVAFEPLPQAPAAPSPPLPGTGSSSAPAIALLVASLLIGVGALIHWNRAERRA